MASSGQKYGVSGKPRPVEAAFQDEFHRCFRDELGPDGGIASERSCPGRGRIDFLAVTPGWGFKLLQDGNGLAEHCKSFERDGIYNQAIQRVIISDWLLLDCRHTVPRDPCKILFFFCPSLYRSLTSTDSQAKLWRVVFSDDYERVRILDNRNEVCNEFALANC